VLVSSRSKLDKDMDTMIDALLSDMMNFVQPSVKVSNKEGAALPRAVDVVQNSSNRMSLSPPPASPLTNTPSDGMDSLDRLFDSLIFSLFAPDNHMQFGPEKSLPDKPSEVSEASAILPKSTAAAKHEEANTVSVEAEGSTPKISSLQGIVEPKANINTYPLQTESEVDSMGDVQGQSLSSVSNILLSRKDVQEDPIKTRFARRLSEWDQPSYPRYYLPSSENNSSTQKLADYPPLLLPFRNSDQVEKCLWEHYQSHSLSSQCYSALDSTKLTFKALKLQQIQNKRNEEAFSQLYLCLVLVFGMTILFALLAILSVHKRANSENSRLGRRIVKAVYKDPSLRSQVESALGQELGDWNEKSDVKCIGRFFILLPTLALALLLLVSAVINPVLVLLVGVPTLICMGVYSCVRDLAGMGGKRNGYPGVTMRKFSRPDVPVTTNSNVYVAIPVV
jgi:hypothetical protein